MGLGTPHCVFSVPLQRPSSVTLYMSTSAVQHHLAVALQQEGRTSLSHFPGRHREGFFLVDLLLWEVNINTRPKRPHRYFCYVALFQCHEHVHWGNQINPQKKRWKDICRQTLDQGEAVAEKKLNTYFCSYQFVQVMHES